MLSTCLNLSQGHSHTVVLAIPVPPGPYSSQGCCCFLLPGTVFPKVTTEPKGFLGCGTFSAKTRKVPANWTHWLASQNECSSRAGVSVAYWCFYSPYKRAQHMVDAQEIFVAWTNEYYTESVLAMGYSGDNHTVSRGSIQYQSWWCWRHKMCSPGSSGGMVVQFGCQLELG